MAKRLTPGQAAYLLNWALLKQRYDALSRETLFEFARTGDWPAECRPRHDEMLRLEAELKRMEPVA